MPPLNDQDQKRKRLRLLELEEEEFQFQQAQKNNTPSVQPKQQEPDDPSLGATLGKAANVTQNLFNRTVERSKPVLKQTLQPREDIDTGSVKGVGNIVKELGDVRPFLPTKKKPVPNLIAEIDKKRRLLETAGTETRQAAEKATGNIVSRISELSNKYLPQGLANVISNGAAITAGAFLTGQSLAPFTPMEFAADTLGATSGSILSKSTRGLQTGAVNRGLNAPKLIREARLRKGQPTVGERALDIPKDVANVTGDQGVLTIDKKQIFDRVTLGVKSLADKIQKKITEVAGKSNLNKPKKIGANLAAFEQQPNSVRTADLINEINQTITETSELLGPNSAPHRSLVKLRKLWESKPPFLNFVEANDARKQLGEAVGKFFQKETSAAPELIDAQRRMWGNLREQIGKIDPELSEMLQLQHDLIDIQNSVSSEASLGFQKFPFDSFEIGRRLLGSNIKTADFLANRAGRDIGSVGLTAASVGGKEDREARQRRAGARPDQALEEIFR